MAKLCTDPHLKFSHSQPLVQWPHDRDFGRTSISTLIAIAACAAPAPDNTQTYISVVSRLPLRSRAVAGVWQQILLI